MANPFLVLGGVAVGVITAGIGVLAVPGWIDSAHDSAAMNDLGNIRGAESAAILQLGEYTDDFAVLKSGELGVKFQKSDTVTLIGLEADSNESWCASVQSKSGRYFAASSDTARFATGPGARAAMLTVGCDPDLITEIIDKAKDGTGPGGTGVSVGDDTGTGGTWVGGTPGAGGGNGANPGVQPAPIGPAAQLKYPAPVAYTSYGVFTIDGDNGRLYRSSDDGKAHLFEPATSGVDFVDYSYDPSHMTFDSSRGLATDAAGNIYAISSAQNEYGRYIPYKIAPDGTATELWRPYDLQPYTGGSQSIGDDFTASAITVAANGTVYLSGEMNNYNGNQWKRGLWKLTNYEFELIGEIRPPSYIAADANGNVYYDCDTICRMSADGSVTELGAGSIGNGFAVAADGSVFSGNSGSIMKVTASGVWTEYARMDTSLWIEGPPDNAWMSVRGVTLDEAGNMYFADQSMGKATVYKILAGGNAESAQVVMR